MAKLTQKGVLHVAKLANIRLTEEQIKKFTAQLSSVISYVSKIQELDTKKIQETSQVTNLENVLREDKVEPERVLSQEDALRNTKRTHNGYFVVDSVFD